VICLNGGWGCGNYISNGKVLANIFLSSLDPKRREPRTPSSAFTQIYSILKSIFYLKVGGNGLRPFDWNWWKIVVSFTLHKSPSTKCQKKVAKKELTKYEEPSIVPIKWEKSFVVGQSDSTSPTPIGS
jgi:hypothetical protein